jgi:hypothetical protein
MLKMVLINRIFRRAMPTVFASLRVIFKSIIRSCIRIQYQALFNTQFFRKISAKLLIDKNDFVLTSHEWCGMI